MLTAMARTTPKKKAAPRKRSLKLNDDSITGEDVATLRVERRNLRSLKAHPKNPRKHPKKDSERWNALRKSLADEYFDPLVVNERNGMLVSGHLRKKIMIAEGIKQADVVVVDCDEDTHVARMIAMNRTAGEDDLPKLADALGELNTAGFDIDLTGLSIAQVEAITSIDDDEETEEEETEDKSMDGVSAPDDPVSVFGEVYHLGPHRLMCGDCRKAEDVETLLQGDEINVAVTSPPYASQRKYDESSQFKPIPPDEYVDWFFEVQDNVQRHLAEDGSWFVNIKEHCEDGERDLYVKDLTLAHKRKWNWRFVDEFIWTHGGTPKSPIQRFKNGWEPIFQFAIGHHKFRPDSVMVDSNSIPDWGGEHPSHEKLQGTDELKDKNTRKNSGSSAKLQDKVGGGKKIQEAVLSKRKFHRTIPGTGNHPNEENIQGEGTIGGGWTADDGKAYPSNVISCGKNREALGHSAAYPIGLPEFFIKAFSDKNDVIYDPFLGSGTTIIAAERNDRVCYGMEISPEYCDIIRMRWTKYCESVGIDPGEDAL